MVAVVAPTGVLHAQRLLEVEGIELRGSARVVEYGAGTCNVSEAHETAASYEQKKANHGQPVDVWQLDFSVYNGSGSPLDHLIANYRVASDNPPCTNWSWPDAGRYPGPIEWGDLAGFIQRSGSGSPTPPGETLTDTKYIFAFHEHAPRFDTWSVDYNFAAAPPAVGADNPVPAGGADARPQPGNERRDPPDSPVGGAPGAVPLPSLGAGETCAGQPVGSGCWMEVANEPGCYLWNEGLVAGATVTWSGECHGGYAQGPGQVTWLYNGVVHTEDGPVAEGRRDGIRIVRHSEGWSARLSHERGQRHGTWVWCRPGRPRNVSGVETYSEGTLFRSYDSYDEIDDRQRAAEAETVCARLLPNGGLSQSGATNEPSAGTRHPLGGRERAKQRPSSSRPSIDFLGITKKGVRDD